MCVCGCGCVGVCVWVCVCVCVCGWVGGCGWVGVGVLYPMHAGIRLFIRNTFLRAPYLIFEVTPPK